MQKNIKGPRDLLAGPSGYLQGINFRRDLAQVVKDVFTGKDGDVIQFIFDA